MSGHVGPSEPTETRVRRADHALLPTEFGMFTVYAYEPLDGAEHAALVFGDPTAVPATLVRVHSSCRTGDVFASLRCDCGPQLHAALAAVADEGTGVVVYLDQEGRGIGLPDKIRAYALQDRGLDTVEANLALGHPADRRTYAAAAQILHDLDVERVRLLTNNFQKVHGLHQHGIDVTQRVPLRVRPNPHNAAYLRTKADRLGHDLPARRPEVDRVAR